jgi:pectinesterase
MDITVLHSLGEHDLHTLYLLSYQTNIFNSFQDTVLAETGNQFYSHCYIEGAVDFIFGQHARAFFHKSTIASVAAGAITAIGPSGSSDVDLCAYGLLW